MRHNAAFFARKGHLPILSYICVCVGQNWQMPFLRKKKEHYVPFSKLIREMPLF